MPTPVEVTVTKVNGGKDYIVTSGLTFGDTIVAEGAGLLRAGTRVQAEQPTAAPQAAPEAEANRYGSRIDPPYFFNSQSGNHIQT